MDQIDPASSVVVQGHAKGPSGTKTYKSEFPSTWIVSSCPPTSVYEFPNLPGAASQMPSRHANNRLNIQRSATAPDSVGLVETISPPTDRTSETPRTPPPIKAEGTRLDSSSNKRERIKRRMVLKNIFLRDANHTVPPGPATYPPLPPTTPRSRFSFFRGMNRERNREPMQYPASGNNIPSRKDASSIWNADHTDQPPAKPKLPAKPVFVPFAEEIQRQTTTDSIRQHFLRSPLLSPSSAESYDSADAPARGPSIAPIYSPSISLKAL